MPKEERQLLRLRTQQSGQLDLLIFDELGSVPASQARAELLFDVIATAYERNSLLVTTNLPLENCLTEYTPPRDPTIRPQLSELRSAFLRYGSCRNAAGNISGSLKEQGDVRRPGNVR